MGSQLVEYPKPLSLLQGLIQLATRDDDIVMDFFAGSSTTAHAVLETNREDNGRRQFIMVQLPEPVDPASTAAREGFATIADIGRERIRRACSAIATDLSESLELIPEPYDR